MSALVRSAKGEPDSILISDNRKPFFELSLAQPNIALPES